MRDQGLSDHFLGTKLLVLTFATRLFVAYTASSFDI